MSFVATSSPLSPRRAPLSLGPLPRTSLLRASRRCAVARGHVPQAEDIVGMPAAPDDRSNTGAIPEIDLQQLRHHTRNTLQRIIGLIGETSGLHDTPEGERIARDLERRICLSATISNALFGVTNAPAPMAVRLRLLGGAIVDMMRGSDQTIRIGVSVLGACPVHLREAVMRSANELIGNAMKHGMKNRSSGRITVRLATRDGVTTLTIVDDGWGFSSRPDAGEGLALARSFAESHAGSLCLDGTEGTVATMALPN